MGVGGGKSGGEDALQHVVTSFGASQTVFLNWPCNLPQLGWITGENSSLERERGDWHTGYFGLRG